MVGLRKERLETFVNWAATHITGDEKGQAQVFLDRLFQGFGHKGLMEAGATLEMRIKKEDAKGTAFADLVEALCARRNEEARRRLGEALSAGV